jgi:ABC-type amino acid transport substrate-binding protein
MIRRTFLTLTLTLFAMAVALGPDAPIGAAGPSVLDRVEKDKVLRVGWAVWHPYVYRDPKSNQVQGVSYDLAQDLAKSLGARVEWVEDSFATLPAGVQAGKFDITNLMAITPPRAQVVDFSEPVTKHDLSLLAPKGEVTKTKDWQDWDRPGIRIVVTLGSNTDMFLTEKFKKAEIVRLKTVPENVLALVSGRANAHASTIDALKTIQREHPEMAIVPGSFGHSDVAFALPQGDAGFAGRVNDFVRQAKKSGRIKELLEKYGLDASFAAD